jgi:hypothetical protein
LNKKKIEIEHESNKIKSKESQQLLKKESQSPQMMETEEEHLLQKSKIVENESKLDMLNLYVKELRASNYVTC